MDSQHHRACCWVYPSSPLYTECGQRWLLSNRSATNTWSTIDFCKMQLSVSTDLRLAFSLASRRKIIIISYIVFVLATVLILNTPKRKSRQSNETWNNAISTTQMISAVWLLHQKTVIHKSSITIPVISEKQTVRHYLSPSIYFRSTSRQWSSYYPPKVFQFGPNLLSHL